MCGGVSAEIKKLNSKMETVLKEYDEAEEAFKKIENKQLTKDIRKIRSKIKKESIKVQSNNEVNFNQAFGKVHIDSKTRYIFLPIEVENPEFQLKGVVIELKNNNRVNGVMEINLEANKEDEKGTIKTWENGELVKNETMKLPEEAFQSVTTESPVNVSVGPSKVNAETLGDRWNTFSDCLDSQGVSYALITLAGAICGGACGVTWGAGCAPCFYGLSFISGGVIGHCFQKALQ
ncbi:hypothetical protein SAMN05421676_101410 [Salinibacillus kushneri]|uniref:Uncharacterized protein n=1 Tax=Salinibacillus kushneri TaxID=237682 RepID=A0A1H9Z7Y0_9BACI|nr:hypothetical protein [Salinibacillus kushneri]SES77185.1 hypothetical protein SAMN05421676_101410 [Salinibacillus kushneri]